jgi:hypothetical protein
MEEMPDINELMAEMRKINPKNLNESFYEISQSGKLSNITICIDKISLVDHPANIRKEAKNYYIEFESINPYDNAFRETFDVEIKSPNGMYKGLDGMFVRRHDQIDKFNFRFTIKVNEIVKGSIKDNLYYRMIIPIQRNVSIMRPFFLPVQSYSSENSFTLGLINVNVQMKEYDIFEVTRDDTRFIFVDCKEKIDKIAFYDETLAIFVSLGFITTYFFQDECYTISSDQNDYSNTITFGYRSLRKSVKLQFNFLGSNSYDYFDRNDAKNHLDEMPAVSQTCLNNLINLVCTNEAIQNCLFVFIVANDNPLNTQPACISVAIEGLCNVRLLPKIRTTYNFGIML